MRVKKRDGEGGDSNAVRISGLVEDDGSVVVTIVVIGFVEVVMVRVWAVVMAAVSEVVRDDKDEVNGGGSGIVTVVSPVDGRTRQVTMACDSSYSTVIITGGSEGVETTVDGGAVVEASTADCRRVLRLLGKGFQTNCFSFSLSMMMES